MNHIKRVLLVISIGFCNCGPSAADPAPKNQELSQSWWEKGTDPVSRFAQHLALRPLSKMVDGSAGVGVRVIIGGELGYMYVYEAILRYDGKRIKATKCALYFCDSLTIPNDGEADADDSYIGRYVNPSFAPDPVGQLAIETLIGVVDTFFVANKEGTGAPLRNDTFVIVERFVNGSYERVGPRSPAAETVYEGNLQAVRTHFSKLLKALFSKLDAD